MSWARRSKPRTTTLTSIAKKRRYEQRELRCYGFGPSRKAGFYRALRQRWRANFGCGKLGPRSRVLRPEYPAMSPFHWVAAQCGQFLGGGYREIRALIASNTPHRLKKAFTGSLAALVLALLAVVVIASQIHPAAVILAVACVLLIVYGRTLFRRLALFAGYFLCGFILFIGAGLITTVPLEKEYPLLAKVVAVALFVVLCIVIPALLSMRPRQEIAAGG